MELEQIIPKEEESIHRALKRMKSKVAYCAPELYDSLWHTTFQELILEEIAPRDEARWGKQAFECWTQHVPRKKQNEP